MANRDIRRVINSKQDSLESTGNLSINSMSDGQISISKSSNELLSINKKKYGRLYKGYLSSSGNQIVDKNLTVRGNLNVKGHIVGSSFKIIAHNMEDDIGTAEVFIPWFGISEAADLTGVSSSFLAPYTMTLKKIMFRPSAISTGSYDLVARLKKMDDGDTTVDTVATATYSPSLSADTFLVIERSDFDNNPKFEIGDNCGVSIQSASGDYGGSIKWKITSVWEVEIVL